MIYAGRTGEGVPTVPDLDLVFPMGNPAAVICRHCHCRRVEHNTARICVTCDGPILSLKIRPRPQEPA